MKGTRMMDTTRLGWKVVAEVCTTAEANLRW